MAGILFLGKHNARAKILQAGLFVSLINIVVLFTLQLIQNTAQTGLEMGTYLVMGAVSGDGMCPVFPSEFCGAADDSGLKAREASSWTESQSRFQKTA